MERRRKQPRNPTIAKAIEHRELLSFIYNGHPRLVEPHTYGISSTGKESLLAYQIKGGHSSDHHEPWHLFSISKMLGVIPTGQTFAGPRKSYKRTWPPMRTIYIQL